ncbi:hypothetical protein [Acetobacterium bakii]|uniref:Uncharacterized protein n=1 Tax=Acetobacterium bakii TaxID=52689 RepID=A0A0L6U481_9FIRM|nr:hypothetical protein [Acetobacterium bakii]KNZ42605.1 hypothetical protein AKG39_05480 [Acetobacterium bakii]
MLSFDISNQYKGSGVSQGLDRGLLVYDDDILLVEEGMGLGACSFQIGGYTHFTSIKSISKAGDSFRVVCKIDKKLVWKALGVKSKSLTRSMEFITTNVYMKQEKRQKRLLELGDVLRRIFNVEASFVDVPAQGEVEITYEIRDNAIFVNLNCETKETGSRIFVMNELGGSIFNRGIIDGKIAAPPTGWEKLKGACELYSYVHGLTFTCVQENIPENVTSKLYWGRERTANNYCWAGFESEIICNSNKFNNYRYSIRFREVA